jgi:hypothetical protein
MRCSTASSSVTSGTSSGSTVSSTEIFIVVQTCLV